METTNETVVETATAAAETAVNEVQAANPNPVEAAPVTESAPAPKKTRKKKKIAAEAVPAPGQSTEVPPDALAAPSEVSAAVQDAAPTPAPEPEIVYESFKLFEVVPDGGPGSDTKAAIPVAVSKENIPSLLNAVARMMLSVTGPRDGYQSDLNPKQFHAGVRVYRPQGKFPGGVTTMDETMYASRVGHRLLNAINKETKAINEGKKFALDGGYGKHTDADVRALAVWEATKKLAAATGTELILPVFVPAPVEAAPTAQ